MAAPGPAWPLPRPWEMQHKPGGSAGSASRKEIEPAAEALSRQSVPFPPELLRVFNDPCSWEN